jgi:rRNA maturation endonuclease Nob1
MINANFIKYLIKMEDSNQDPQPEKSDEMKEKEEEYSKQIDNFKDKFKDQVPDSKDIRTVRKFLEKYTDIMNLSTGNINQFLHILKVLHTNKDKMTNYGQIDNYTVILNRLKENEQFWKNIPK